MAADPKDPKPVSVDPESVKNAENLREIFRGITGETARTLEQQEEYVEVLKKAEELERKTAVSAEEISKTQSKKIKLIQEEYQLAIKRLQRQKESGLITEQEYEQRLKIAKEEKEHLKRTEKDKELQEGMLKTLKHSLSTLYGMSAIQQKLSAGFSKTGAAASLIYDRMSAMVQEMQELSVESAKAGISMTDAYSFFSTDQMSTLTGLTRDANGEMRTMTQFGIGFRELTKSQNELRTSMAGFSDQTSQSRNMLAGNAAQMEKLGVSVSESGKNYNFLMKSLQMTGQQAAKTNDMLARTAIAAGIPVKKMLGDFAQIGPQLAAQGPKAVEVFKDLAKQAKSLGVEVSDLLGVFGSAMDTFEGAATTAGKFNAVMGGDYLNAMELLNATESERVDIVKRQMDATGKNFATMSKYEKIAVANALGIKDVNQAQMMLSGSTEEMRKKREQEAASQDKLNQLQSQAVDTLTKLKSMFDVLFAAVAPLVTALGFIADKIAVFNDLTNGFAAIAAIAGILGFKIFTMWKNTEADTLAKTKNFLETQKLGMEQQKEINRLKELSAQLKAGEKATRKLTEAEEAEAKAYDKMNRGTKIKGFFSILMTALPVILMLWTQIHDILLVPNSPILLDVLSETLPAALEKIGESAEKLIKPMLALGASMLMVGAGVFLAAYGMAQLVKSFTGLSGPQIIGAVAALLIFSAAMVGIVAVLAALAFSGVGPAAVGLLLAFGGAFLMIGAGVFLAATGMAIFVGKITQLASVGVGGAAALALISASLLMLSVSIGVLMVSLLGLMMLGASGPLGFIALAAGVAMATLAIMGLAKAFEKFPAEKSITFTASTEALAKTLAMVKEVKSEDVKPTIEVMKAAQEYMIVSSIAKLFKGEDPAVKLLQKILEVANVGVSKAGTGGEQTYKIMINDKVFGELVKNAAGGSTMDNKVAKTLST